jgi:hypothetical protein
MQPEETTGSLEKRCPIFIGLGCMLNNNFKDSLDTATASGYKELWIYLKPNQP